MVSDIIVFLRRFFTQPDLIGSVIPSSRFLTKRMMEQVPWETSRVIVELGPGTGVFTKDILKRKRLDASFFVIEKDQQFQTMLQSRFPGLVVCDEARNLLHYLREMNLPKVDVIISSLPFAVFPEEIRASILDQVVESLAPGGKFITYQYSLQLKKELESRFDEINLGFTPFNIPPAFVYTCQNNKDSNRAK